MKKKIILVTGCSGFIGKHLCNNLSKTYNIIGIDKVRGEINKDVDFYKQDINDAPIFRDKVYAVIHLAAKAGVRESQSNYKQYVLDNIIGTKSILDNCVEYWKPEKILIASSSSIYGDRNNNEYHPKSLYAMSKVATEMIAESYRNSELLPETKICSIRIFTVYGPGQRKGLAIGNFIDNMLQDKSIIVYGDGTQKRDFTYVEDLCGGIEFLLREPNPEIPNTTDIGWGTSTTINEIIHNISKLLNKKVTIQYEDWDKQDVYETKSKLNDWLYGKPTPLEEGLRRQIKWQEKELMK